MNKRRSLPPNLGLDDRKKIIACLLKMSCLSNQDDRLNVLKELPDVIRNGIREGSTTKTHITNIVDKCNTQSGGLNALIEIIEYWEEGTDQFKHLEEVVGEIATEIKMNEVVQKVKSGQDPHRDVEELHQEDVNQGDRKKRLDQFDRHIHKIDFAELEEFLERGVGHIRKGYYFVRCCLFVDSDRMGAKWGVKKIEEKLDSLGCGIRKIEIASVDGTDINSDIILKRLIHEFGLEVSPSNVHIDNITDQICRTFHQGRQLLIKIHDCHQLNTEDWSWIHKKFWTALLKKIDQLTVEEREGISVLVLLLTKMPIKRVRVDEWCEYSPNDEKSHEIITRMPLSNWTQDDIRRWINNCFPSFSSQFEKQKFTEKIEELYTETVEGMPELVYQRLRKMIGGPDYAD